MKLYEIAAAYQNVLDLIEEDQGNEELSDVLDTIGGSIEEKVENTAKLIKNMEANSKAIREEERRLAKKRRTIDNQINNIKEYTQHHLEVVGIDKVSTPVFTVAVQNNPQSVIFTDEDLIPDKYKEEVVTTKIPKKAILDDLKEGIEVPGTMINQTRSLRIR